MSYKKLLNLCLKTFFLIFFINAYAAKPLPTDAAFQLQAEVQDPNTVSLTFSMNPGYFLYSERFKFEKAFEKEAVTLGTLSFPQPLMEKSKEDKDISVYRDKLTLSLPILGEKEGEFALNIGYQGCSDDGFCYPPVKKTLFLTINSEHAITKVSFNAEKAAPALAPQQVSFLEEREQPNASKALFQKHHFGITLLIFFGFGVLLAFTPCVLPMVPVLSSMIVGHGENISTKKAFLLSLSYVISMAFTYAITGALVALLGSNLQIIMQSPIAITAFSALFVLLSFSMFGYFELKIPVNLQSRLAKANLSHAHGHYLGAAIMGMLSTLILSPCVTAPLVGILGYIAESGNVFIGSTTLFVLGLGMGFPLLLVGASAGKLLPKTGRWMNSVKYFFGVLLIAVAIQLFSRIIPPPLSMGLWAILFVFTGVFCGAFIKASDTHEKIRKASGILLLVYGLLLLIGAAMGKADPLQPLGTIASQKQILATLSHETVNTLSQAENAQLKAKNRRKPLLLDFYADWCSSCKVLENTAFKDPSVLSLLKNVKKLKVDLTQNTKETEALLQHYNVIAPPTLLFFDEDGNEVKELRLVGSISQKLLKEHLLKVQNKEVIS